MRHHALARVMGVVAAAGIAGAASAAESSPGRFSAALHAGASLPDHDLNPDGHPLLIGLTASYWVSEWLIFDASPTYMFDSGKLNLLAGPRFRLGLGPVGVHLGLQAGVVLREPLAPRIAVSPQAGVDTLLSGRYIVGVGYAGDLTFVAGTLKHRFFATLGYRF